MVESHLVLNMDDHDINVCMNMNYANVQDENALRLFFIELASEPWANVIVQIFNGHN